MIPIKRIIAITTIIFGLNLLILQTARAQGDRINVPADYTAIQAAIDASTNGDTVLVQPGTYIENINFNGKNIVVGSLTLTTGDTSYISQTIIDGNQDTSVVIFSNGETSAAVLSGLTIQNGSATSGGGIYLSNSSPSLLNLNIRENETVSWRYGGGIYCYNSSPRLNNVMLSGNSAVTGGGMFLNHYSSPILENVAISGNTATYAGGIWCDNLSSLILHNATITKNTNSGIVLSNASTCVVMNTIFWNNSQNIEFRENLAPNTISVSHSDIQGGQEGIVNNSNGTVNWLSGNIDLYPEFVDSANSDYRLSDTSPCIARGADSVQIGSTWYYAPTIDLDGNPRPMPEGTRSDMGAYENQTAYPDTTYITGGTITQDSTWTKARSPYVISGDVIVDNGATLTIEPGVECIIRAEGSENAGYWDGLTEIVLNSGIIQAIGTEQDSIWFHGEAETPNAWGGFYMQHQNPDTSAFEYCKIENAMIAIFQNSNSNENSMQISRINNCSFYYNYTNIFIEGGLPSTIENNTFNHFYFGVLLHPQNYSVSNNLFQNIDFLDLNLSIPYGGGSGSRAISSRRSEISNNTFTSCNWALIIFEDSNIFENTFISSNPSLFFEAGGNNSIIVHNNFTDDGEILDINGGIGGPELNAQFNWWGTETTNEINLGGNPKNLTNIYDWNDYGDPVAIVNYSHWLDAPYPGGQPAGDTYNAELLITDNQYTDDMLTYHSGDSIFIQITDLDRNSDNIIPDQLTLDIWSESETTHETLTLNETDLATGIFRGWIKLDDATGVPFPDGQLQVGHGDWMYFRYIDPADDWGNVDTIFTGKIYELYILENYTLNQDSSLGTDNSPYLIINDMLVNSELTINAGVDIYSLPEGGVATVYEGTEIIINGRLIAEGIPTDSISFRNYHIDKQVMDESLMWTGFQLNGSDTSSFKYCNVNSSRRGITIAQSAVATITNCIFEYNVMPLEIFSSVDHISRIDSCIIRDNWTGIEVKGQVEIFNNEIVNNNWVGIELSDSKAIAHIEHNTISDNTYSISTGEGGIVRAKYNNITNLIGVGPGAIFTLNYNNLSYTHHDIHIYANINSNVDAKFNYWGPVATPEMNSGDNPKNISTISDYFDNPSYGMVNYSHWLDAPWPDGTPAPGGTTGETRFIYSDGTEAWGYNEGDTLYIKLYDPDLNTDINTPEYATVEVWSQLEAVPELLNLNEVDADTGLFMGWMLLDGQTGFAMTDGVLQVDQGNRVWVQYTDAVDDWNNQNTTVLDSVTYDFRIREYEPDENTVLLLHLNEGTGQYVSDESSNNWSGYIGTSDQIEEDDPSWTSNGISNSGIQFDVGDRFYYYINSGFMENDELTAECWINIHDDTGQRQNIITANGSFALYRDGNNKISLHLYLSEGSVGGFIGSDKSVFEYGKWHHCAIVKTSDSLKVFVDKHFACGAEFSGQLPNYSSASMLELRFGAIPEGNYSFKGVKDEIRLSNIARTSFDYDYTENPPGKINDLAVTDSSSQSITLQWHAPGADNYTGTCEIYDLRLSTSPIDSANFTSATPVSGLPSPASAGTLESFTIDSLNYATTYYFALKAKDDEGLWSPISNIAIGHTEPKDEIPPGTISNLALSSVSKRSAIISWTAPADDGQSGRSISGYSIYYATFPINSTNFTTADSIMHPCNHTIMPGVAISDTLISLLPNTLYYVAVRSYDEVPNWSALSNVLELSTEAVPVIANTTFPINAYDAQRSRSVPYNGATLGTFRWTFSTGAAVSSSPVIDNDGTVYVGSEDGKVYAVDPGGNELWSKSLGAGVFAAPCIGTENHLFVTCKNNKVYALNKANGDTIWTYTTGGQVYGSPVISSFGYLYVGALDNKVYALTSDAGDLVWTFTGSGKFYASPALTIDESKLIIGDQAGKLYALNPNSGAKLWEYPVNSAIYANAAIDSAGNVYCGAQNGNLYCLSSTGAYKWDYNTGGAIFYASPTLGYRNTEKGTWNTEKGKESKENSKLQSEEHAAKLQNEKFPSDRRSGKSQSARTDNSKLLSNDQANKFPISNFPSDSRAGKSQNKKFPSDRRAGESQSVKSIQPPRLNDEVGQAFSGFPFPVSGISDSSAQTVYIGSDGDKLHAVNASTGAQQWTYTTQGDIRNGAVLSANGYLYFGSADDSLYCIKNDGTRRWAYKTGGDLYTSNPAMGLDGAVYIGSYDNKLYAVGEYLEVVDPVVVATYPTVNSCTAPADTSIRVKFNTIINMNTVDENSIYVFGNYRGGYDYLYEWSSDDSTLIIDPNQNFFYGEEIKVILKDIQSVSGGILINESFQMTFTSKVGSQEIDWTGNIDWETHTDGLSFSDIQYADIDFDGDIDLIAVVTISSSSTGNDGDILIFENRGSNFNPIPIQSIPTDNYGGSLVLSDINNDGLIDISVKASQGIDIYFNKGGYFSTNPSMELDINHDEYTPYVFADMNNDTYPDLLVVNWSGYCCLYTNIEGVINELPDWTSNYINPGTGHNNIVTSDFDNDGMLDLLVSYCIFYNNNLFGDEPDVILNNSCQPAFSQDINNDGYKDILYSGGNVYINNNGSFDVNQSYSFSNETSSGGNIRYCKDINGDGYIDIGSSNEIFLNDMGFFNGVTISLDMPNYPSRVVDIDNNSMMDFTWWNQFSPEIRFEYSGYLPTDLPPRILGHSPRINQYAINPEDSIRISFSKSINSNTINTSNIAIISESSGPISFSWEMTNDYTLILSPIDPYNFEDKITVNIFPGIKDQNGSPLDYTYDFNFYTRSEIIYKGLNDHADWISTELFNFAYVDLGNVDQDELPELLVSADQSVKVFKNIDGQIAYIMWQISSSYYAVNAYYYDIDNDGYEDVLIIEDNMLSLYKNYSGHLTTTPFWTYQNSENIGDLQFADFDNDSYIDFAIASGSYLSSSAIFKNNSGNLDETPFWNHTSLNYTSSESIVCAWGDYNKDGFVDIIFGDQIYKNNNGNFNESHDIKLTDYSNSGAIGKISFIDLDNDGFPEISDGSHFWDNNDGIIQTTPYRSDYKYWGLYAYWADINNDGYTDLINVRLDNKFSYNSSNLIYYNSNGTIPQYPSWITNEEYATQACAIGDLDADGDLDIIFGTSWCSHDPITIYYNHSEWVFNISIDQMTEPEYSGTFTISYTIDNPGNNPTSLTCRYSADNGSTWKVPTTASDTTDIGNTAYEGSIEWQSMVDLPGKDIADVIFAMTPYDNVNTGKSDTVHIHVDNNLPPTAQIVDITGEQSGDVPVTINYSDAEGDTVSLQIDFALTGTDTWTTAVTDVNTGGLTGTAVSFNWLTNSDQPNQSGSYWLRVTPNDKDTGTPDTLIIRLDNYHQQTIALSINENPVRDTLAVSYVITDPTNDTLKLICRYSIDAQFNSGDKAAAVLSKAADVIKNSLVTKSSKSSVKKPVKVSKSTELVEITNLGNPVNPVKNSTATEWQLPYIVSDTLQITPAEYSGILQWYTHYNLPGMDIDSVVLVIRPADNWQIGAGDTLIFELDNNRSPVVTLVPITWEESDSVTIHYSITDAEGDQASVYCEYKRKYELNWHPATVIGDTVNLATGDHSIIWLSTNDVPAYVGNVIFRITPKDNDKGEATSIEILLDQIGAPIVTALSVGSADEYSGDIPVNFTIRDDEEDAIDLVIQFFLDDGATWQNATVSGSTQDITPQNYSGQFVWHSGTDAPGKDLPQVRLKAIPYDQNEGGYLITDPFHLDNNEPPIMSLNIDYQEVSGDVTIPYSVVDNEQDSVSLNISYSIDDGNNWTPASIDGDTTIGSDQYTGNIIWRSTEDLPHKDIEQVAIRAECSDSDLGVPDTIWLHVDNNLPPTVALAPITAEQHDTVYVEYDAFDEEDDTLQFEVRYSCDNGTSWNNANYSIGNDKIVWLSNDDLPDRFVSELSFKVIVSDRDAGIGDTIRFNLDNYQLQAIDLHDNDEIQKDSIVIEYTLTDVTEDTIDLMVSYSVDAGNTWHYDMSLAPGFINNVGVENNYFIWDSKKDIPGYDGFASVSVIPHDGWGPGKPDTTVIRIDNNLPPVVTIADIYAEQHDTVGISFTAIDKESDAITCVSLYSIDAGANWILASVNYLENGLLWSSQDDIVDLESNSVWFKIIPSDNNPGEADSIILHIDNDQGNIVLTELQGEQTGDVRVPYHIQESGNDTLSLQAFYRLKDAVDWFTATLAEMGDILPAMYDSVIIWRSDVDLPHQCLEDVLFRTVPADRWGAGKADTIVIDIDNEIGPVVTFHSPYSLDQDTSGWKESIFVIFDHDIDTNTVNGQISINSKVVGAMSHQLYFISKAELEIIPDGFYGSLDTITVALSAGITDEFGIPLDGNLNGDPDGSPADDYSFQFRTALLGDYDTDGDVDIVDFYTLRDAWTAEPPDYSKELGPVTGTLPQYILTPDNQFNLKDLMVLISAWNWTFDHHYNTFASFGLAKSISNEQSPISLITNYEKDGKWNAALQSGLALELNVNLKDACLGSEVVVRYDPEILEYNRFVPSNIDKESGDWIVLDRHDPERGLILVTVFKMGNVDYDISAFKSIGRLDFTTKQNTCTEVEYLTNLCMEAADTIYFVKQHSSYSFETSPPVPTRFALHQNFPNPFNPITTIRYELPKESEVRLAIFNLKGEIVKALVHEQKQPGYYEVRWDGTTDSGTLVSSGIYFYRVQAGRYVKTNKMVLMK